MPTFRSILILLVVVFTLNACIEPYDIRYDLSTDVLTVEGIVTDEPGSTVILKRSKSDISTYTVPLKGCVVEIIVGDGSKINLTETQPNVSGVYVTPTNFRGVVGQTYQLQFKTPEGQTYQSSIEPLIAAPTIKKTYQTFNAKGLLDRTGTRVLGSTFDIFVDYDDPAAQKNFYLWKWQLFEKQDVCITCEQGFLGIPNLQCINGSTRFTTHPTYDYQCLSNCWDIFYSSDINVLADVFSNGRTITGRKVAQIPYYSENGALVEVQQYAISNEAYQYYVLLRDQTQTTGTLADTPPAPIVGNVKNVNDRGEIVVGYFGASGVSKTRYWIDRKGYAGQGGVRVPLLGRETNFEPASPPLRPPQFPCRASLSRTPLQPAGWR